VVMMTMMVMVLLIIHSVDCFVVWIFQASWILLLLGYVFVPIYLKGGVSDTISWNVHRYQGYTFLLTNVVFIAGVHHAGVFKKPL
jgi:hypothetical protein